MSEGKPVANQVVVLREEFDDWALLFHPDTGEALGVNPVGVFIWKHLDGKHSLAEIAAQISASFEAVPSEADAHVREFVEDLVRRGLAGYEIVKE